jgi:hypothetical protein
MKMWNRRRRVVITLAGLLLLSTAPARAALLPPLGLPVTPPAAETPTAIGHLGSRTPVLTFHGTAGNPTPLPLVNSPVPVVCAVGCQEFEFTTDAGAPFLVSLRDTQHSTDDGFDLSVYDPNGMLVDAGNGIGADGQAIAVAEPVAGTYTIVVTFTYEYQPDAAYDGEVRRMTGRSWRPAKATCGITVAGVSGCFTLPILEAVPASGLHVDGLPPAASTPLGFPLPVELPTSNSCYVDEAIGITQPDVGTPQQPVTRCLRFTTDVRNIGAAALKIRIPWLVAGAGGSPVASGFVPGQCQAEQAVLTTSGDEVTRPAGACLFHAVHAHFHYSDLVSFTLHAVTPDGLTGPPIGKSQKESFCLADDDYFGFGSAGPNGPRGYVGQPGCNLPANPPPQITVEEGVSPGWGDVYTWDTPGQFVDISTVAPGTYDIIEKTNPTGDILVAGPQQTCSRTRLQLTETAVTQVSTADAVPCPPA